MRHAYLTKEEIDRAYRLGGITTTEVKELLEKLQRCSKLEATNEKAVSQSVS